ncbi:hypothetical protein LTR36_000071 [Oleoguttula mirabilis]|uniref:Uncharacterized protein n=1 Tax=Oleoguttula mirabilis TaxID=1507867 RepID=A0AAV9JZJ9_9PEZI|nr:hypothetical protein LTR36_000071 [Oleoguttula mirabilis]
MVQLRIAEYATGNQRIPDSQYFRGKLLSTKHDAVLLEPQSSETEIIALIRKFLARRSLLDLPPVLMHAWPRGAGPGTAAGNMELHWDGASIPVHDANWPAVKNYLRSSGAPLEAWFFVVPQRTTRSAASEADAPPAYESVRNRGGTLPS